jgi:large subunit ribosomal protein L22
VAVRPAAASLQVVAAAATEAAPAAVAHFRYGMGSPLKVRRVLDQIRGRSYEEALMILEYMPYRACEPIIKTLISAAANAKHNLGMKKKSLYVAECYANEGPVLKRAQPRAQGRAYPILKPSVHITVKVMEREA